MTILSYLILKAECFNEDLYLENTEKFNARKAQKKTPKATPRQKSTSLPSETPTTTSKRSRKSDAADGQQKKAKQETPLSRRELKALEEKALSESQALMRLRAKIQVNSPFTLLTEEIHSV
jgi:hypothetical protein